MVGSNAASWDDYVAQGKGLLDHLNIGTAHLMGGCVGCSTVLALGVSYPEAVSSMVLFSPAGGVRYRLTQHARFAHHLTFVAEHGLEKVVELANSHDSGFAKDPRVGPWVSVLRSDAAFSYTYAGWDPDSYQLLVSGMARLLFDRDTLPGAEPEDLLRLTIPALVVPGQDTSHATSAARYLELRACGPAGDLSSGNRLAALQCRDLVQASLVAATLERRREPGGGDLLGQLRRYDLGCQHQNVGIVVGARDLRAE